MEKVINQQPTEVQDFLFATSILEQLAAPLCNALVDRQDSQTILEQLERAYLFLIPLDDERQWYRYHHLFADLLRKWLKQRQPARFAGLHERASMWYAENNMLSRAIRHALDAGDAALVNRLGVLKVHRLGMVALFVTNIIVQLAMCPNSGAQYRSAMRRIVAFDASALRLYNQSWRAPWRSVYVIRQTRTHAGRAA